MSDLKVDGFQACILAPQSAKLSNLLCQSSDLIAAINEQFSTMSDTEKAAQVNGIIELEVTNADKVTTTWTLDLKKTGTVYLGKAKTKADVTVILSDETLVGLATGKLNGQKAFMTGKLKTKGNMMLATKLDGVLKAGKPKAKL
ncbi:SCP2 domain-containing protein [Mycena indigotica]|uniref:SCP2 domain-containing protein n=1 Tax=Mycena indigotica TaxID=2126181 RepID=A0A8H6T7H9_9AGAR|nr:SCP2 domain-containing protein [Mycena indigotica]KAF7312214.1 SCP2 domain-containing protein [Mycena indigotica]